MKRKREKEKAIAVKNASSPPQGSVIQQCGVVPHVQPPSGLHAAVATSFTTPAIASTPAFAPSTASLPDAMIPRAGRWTRFRLFICCFSAQYTDGQH
ncbi:hypothetical protein K503DRAFT_870670 [Rhizopogon vinicolor AM-OR11-026]|uniref:Uncharacterized protein n=1 Tax=Rhizopogon vinicolor AM-OR11-026 TaxID=1314800 RepID=A0A1B7MFG1_9AGAM|nr:hypothetical protein K503DRAFT_870670 [Rhizopogon vinicolor AM-OR11-026]